MTIPQGDNRGATSVSERRKVTFEGDQPASGQKLSTTKAASSGASNAVTTYTTTATTTAKSTAAAAAGSSAYALTSSASSDSSSASSSHLAATAAAVLEPCSAATKVNPAYDLTPDADSGALTLSPGCCAYTRPAQAQYHYHPTDGDFSLPTLHTSLDSYTKSQVDDQRSRLRASQLLHDAETFNATQPSSLVPSQDIRKSPLPLLNFFIPDDSLHSSSFSSSVSSFSDRSRKISLNLQRPSKSQLSDAESSDRVRRYSQPSKSTYHRVPLDDPSPTHNRFSSDFTLSFQGSSSVGGETNQAFRQHPAVETHCHSAQVHTPFGTLQDASLTRTCPVNPAAAATTVSTQREASPNKNDSLSAKRDFFRKQRIPAPGGGPSNPSSNTSKSLDDLSLAKRQGQGGAGARGSSPAPPSALSFTTASSRGAKLSTSTDNISLSFRRNQQTVPGPGGGGARRHVTGDRSHHQHQHPPPSPGSPSRCCLVSVSRVPMAAATSHLTLDSDYQTVRLAVLGAPGVGKSSIVRQFVMQQFPEEYVPTEQRQVFCPAVIINEHLYEVRIIDCPYIPYFPVNSLYEWTDFRGYGLRNATAYVLVYDITSEDSFEYIKSLRLQILESRSRQDVPIFVVGNKHDLAEERGVPRREVANMVKKQWKCGYIECSAKFNWHIMLLFKELMKSIDYIDYGHKPTSMRVQDALRRNRCVIL